MESRFRQIQKTEAMGDPGRRTCPRLQQHPGHHHWLCGAAPSAGAESPGRLRQPEAEPPCRRARPQPDGSGLSLQPPAGTGNQALDPLSVVRETVRLLWSSLPCTIEIREQVPVKPAFVRGHPSRTLGPDESVHERGAHHAGARGTLPVRLEEQGTKPAGEKASDFLEPGPPRHKPETPCCFRVLGVCVPGRIHAPGAPAGRSQHGPGGVGRGADCARHEP